MRVSKKVKKECLFCKKMFLTYPSHFERRKYCSEACNVKGSNFSHKGIKHTEIAKKKISIGHIGKNIGNKNKAWKGDMVGYRALHDWVVSKLGKPDTCEHCKKANLSGRNIHWANKSHSYMRELGDWIRLCVSCHKIYDRK